MLEAFEIQFSPADYNKLYFALIEIWTNELNIAKFAIE